MLMLDNAVGHSLSLSFCLNISRSVPVVFFDPYFCLSSSHILYTRAIRCAVIIFVSTSVPIHPSWLLYSPFFLASLFLSLSVTRSASLCPSASAFSLPSDILSRQVFVSPLLWFVLLPCNFHPFSAHTRFSSLS